MRSSGEGETWGGEYGKSSKTDESFSLIGEGLVGFGWKQKCAECQDAVTCTEGRVVSRGHWIDSLDLGRVWGIERIEGSRRTLVFQSVDFNCHIGARRSPRSYLVNNFPPTPLNEALAMLLRQDCRCAQGSGGGLIRHQFLRAESVRVSECRCLGENTPAWWAMGLGQFGPAQGGSLCNHRLSRTGALGRYWLDGLLWLHS